MSEPITAESIFENFAREINPIPPHIERRILSVWPSAKIEFGNCNPVILKMEADGEEWEKTSIAHHHRLCEYLVREYENKGAKYWINSQYRTENDTYITSIVTDPHE